MTPVHDPLHDPATGKLATAPFFSVVIPLYNKRPYIRRAVNSVLRQTFTDFELIVVDDGSTDGSHEVLADIGDTRYRFVRQENQGGAGGQARNTGMAQARGNWCAFLDGDDMWLPMHLAELKRIIDRHPDAGLISPRPLEHSDGTDVDPADSPTAEIRRVDYFFEAARQIGMNNASSSAIPRTVFRELGGFINIRSGPDLEYWARIALRYPVVLSSRVTSIYFRDTNGNMEQIAKERGRSVKPVTELRDLSPSVRMLCEVAEREPARWQDPGIRAYLNSRIHNGIKGALYRGDLDAARQYAKLHLEPLPLKWRAVRLLLSLPDAAINSLLAAYRGTRVLKRGGNS